MGGGQAGCDGVHCRPRREARAGSSADRPGAAAGAGIIGWLTVTSSIHGADSVLCMLIFAAHRDPGRCGRRLAVLPHRCAREGSSLCTQIAILQALQCQAGEAVGGGGGCGDGCGGGLWYDHSVRECELTLAALFDSCIMCIQRVLRFKQKVMRQKMSRTNSSSTVSSAKSVNLDAPLGRMRGNGMSYSSMKDKAVRANRACSGC